MAILESAHGSHSLPISPQRAGFSYMETEPSLHSPLNIKSVAKKAKSSNVQASFTLFKVFVGSGILALPASFAKVGFIPAFIGTLIVAILTYYCMVLLIRVMDSLDTDGSMSLQKLADKILGRWAKISVEISLILMQVGAAVAVLIFAKKFLSHVTCGVNVELICNNNYLFALFAALIIVPLSFINNMHYFYYPSILATFFICVNVLTQIFYNFTFIAKQEELEGGLWSRILDTDLTQLPAFFGVAVYAFEGIGVIFSVRSAMQQPESFPQVIKLQMAIIGLLYVIFSATSVLAFGRNIEKIILFSQPATDGFYMSIQSLYVLSALLSYPLALFPALNVIEKSSFFNHRLFDEHGERINPVYTYSMRAILTAFMLLVAITTKSFNDFVSLLGSGVFVYCGFLLPVIIYHTHFRGQISGLGWIANIFTFVVSGVLGAIGIFVSIKELA